MPIEFHCPNCQKLLRTSDEKAGRTANCPGCGSQVTVPAATPGAPSGPMETPSADAGEFQFASPPPVDASGASSTPGAESAELKACPMCGEMIKAQAIRCRFCGEAIAPGVGSSLPGRYTEPHRGGLILALGIVGLLCCQFVGIAAWVMGNEDLKKMNAGIMDPAGEGLTKAGKIIGIVAMILMAVNLLFYVAMIVIGALS